MIQKTKSIRPADIFFITLLFIFLLDSSMCLAEYIYYKDGRRVEAEIVKRTKDTVWIQYAGGTIGVDSKEISKILNSDGSVSKYGVGYLVDQIQGLVKEKKYIEAEKSCTFLLESSPEDSRMRYLHGMLNQKLGNASKAIEDYNFLVSRKDADDAIFNNLGAIDAQSEKYDDAADLFYKAIKCNPQKVEFHNNLAELFMSVKNYDKAIEEYNNVLKLEPGNLVALFNLGVVYKNKGDYLKAGKQWQRVLAVKPDDPDAKKALLSLGKVKNK